MSEITYNNGVIYNGGDSPVTLKTRNKVMLSDVVVENPPTEGYTEFTVSRDNPNLDGTPTSMVDVNFFDNIDGKNITVDVPIQTNHGYIMPTINGDVGEHFIFMNLMLPDRFHTMDITLVVDGEERLAPYSDENHFIIVMSDTYTHKIDIFLHEHHE